MRFADPPGMRRLAVILVLSVVVLSAALVVRLRFQNRALHGPSGGAGEIEGTEVDLSSRVGARIDKLHVRKGVAVKKGELLVSLDCADVRASLSEAEERLAAAQAQARVSQEAIGAARSSQQVAAAARLAAQAQAASLAAQRDATLRQVRRLEKLEDDVAAANRDQTTASAEGLRHQVEAMQAQANASLGQARAAGANWKASAAQAEAAFASARAVAAGLARVRLLVDECEVRAPRDGTITELPHEVGELVSPGSVLARLLDLSEVRATFYLPNAELAAVHPGGGAVVVADAYPGVRFRARVSTVALKAEFTPRNVQTRSDRDRLVYPVEVVLDNPDGRLRAGMPVQVTLPGTERL
jgi:HlyD family secretion protein